MSKQRQVVVGLGKTGLSLVRFLVRQGMPVAAIDTREQPPELAALQAEFPQVELHCGSLTTPLLMQAQTLYLSPGLAVDTAEIQAALAQGAQLSGDVDLFLQHAQAPVIAITGSNAKSTVTALVGAMAQAAGVRVAVGGNIGTPILNLLAADIELYVLELSSFQLETIRHLQAEVAVCLNISADHLDRYRDLAHYTDVKLQVYTQAKHAVINRDDLAAQPQATPAAVLSFGVEAPAEGQFGLLNLNNEQYLAQGAQCLLPVNALKIRGTHNASNALAALAIGQAAGLPMAAMLRALREFPGLAHRCQWVAERGDVQWYNDSKATNVGATLAAIEGLAQAEHRLVLIAGGDGKGAAFGELAEAVRSHCRAVIVLGQDAQRIEDALRATGVAIQHVSSIEQAVSCAAAVAQPGDSVLLAPACASWDMFKNFEQRGELFVQAVEALA